MTGQSVGHRLAAKRAVHRGQQGEIATGASAGAATYAGSDAAVAGAAGGTCGSAGGV